MGGVCLTYFLCKWKCVDDREGKGRKERVGFVMKGGLERRERRGGEKEEGSWYCTVGRQVCRFSLIMSWKLQIEWMVALTHLLD